MFGMVVFFNFSEYTNLNLIYTSQLYDWRTSSVRNGSGIMARRKAGNVFPLSTKLCQPRWFLKGTTGNEDAFRLIRQKYVPG